MEKKYRAADPGRKQLAKKNPGIGFALREYTAVL
jgi:hypothetical protein